ncbi:MAG TPA: tetratricopeptide repeat protein [Candidatus Udaeobacter sp.]|nr:tetratricopeptide repeat protein [Candidatus Udaeobacter sp.]
MSQGNFFSELKRRNVYKVAVAYAVVGWLIAQIATQIFPFLEIPNWVVRLVIVLIATGFPIALVIAWAFEATPEGIKRTEVADAARQRSRGKAWIYVVLIGGAISLGLFFLGRYTAAPRQSASPARSESSTASLPAKSIAVLPFDNLSRDPDNAFFAEGVQDEILTRLAKVADLKVIARTSTQKFKSSPENLPDIANQLGALNILEGSVQKANDQVRVNVQLINAMTNSHLWAEIYDRKLTDIFAVESDIAKTIADTLQAKLTGSEKTAMSKQPTADTEAYELYHKGLSFWGQRSGDNLPKSIGFYEQAIARDPNYALAYAGLANSYILLPYYTATPLHDAATKARASALKALQLDPNLAEGHIALGKIISFEDMDLAGASREFERAIEIQPNNATAHHWYGNGPLAALGKFDEAIAEGKKSIELDPLSPIINADHGNNLYYARRYDEAIVQLRKAVELDPAFFYTHYNLGLALQAKGDLQGAIIEYEKATQLSDDPFAVALLAAAKAKSGDKNAAEQALNELHRIPQSREGVAYGRAVLYLSLGQREQALHWLEQSFADRDGSNIGYIKVEPLMDPLRGDPRFEALVQKVIAPK